MIRNFFGWLIQPMGRIAVLIAALTFFSLAAFGIYYTQQSPEQPIQFTHKLHVNLGVQCLYCHPGALRGPSPGLPTLTKCWGCHQQIAKTNTSPKLAVLKDYVLNNKADCLGASCSGAGFCPFCSSPSYSSRIELRNLSW